MHSDSISVTLSSTLLLGCNNSLSLLEPTCEGWSLDDKLVIGVLGFGLVEVVVGAVLDGVLVLIRSGLVATCGLLAVVGWSGLVLISSWLVARLGCVGRAGCVGGGCTAVG